MAMYRFKATGKREGQSFILLDKYQFVKGELVATGKEARAYKPILCDFYACTVERIEDQDAPLADPNDPDNEDDLEIVDVTPAKPKGKA